jgi:hypothetical protein
MRCELVEMTRDGIIYWDYSYTVDVISVDGAMEHFQTQERAQALPYIPADARRLAMDAVCEALAALIDHVNPGRVYCVTKDRDPDHWALARHFRIREVIERKGYFVAEEGSDPFNRRFLTMAKVRN